MNLRNRLIWIAALTVAFAGVQIIASRRNAEREIREYMKDKLLPLANDCAAPGSHGVLTLQLRLVPEGKLDATIERVELAATSELQDGKLADCIRVRARNLTLKHPLPSGPEQVELELPIDPPAPSPRY